MHVIMADVHRPTNTATCLCVRLCVCVYLSVYSNTFGTHRPCHAHLGTTGKASFHPISPCFVPHRLPYMIPGVSTGIAGIQFFAEVKLRVLQASNLIPADVTTGVAPPEPGGDPAIAAAPLSMRQTRQTRGRWGTILGLSASPLFGRLTSGLKSTIQLVLLC